MKTRMLHVALALAAVTAAANAQNLKTRVDAIVTDKSVAAARSGVLIIDLSTRRPVYSRRADELFIPASNMKLLTTAAAIDKLGSEFKFVTTFALGGTDLVIVGSGDPGLGDERLAQREGTSIKAPFLAVAAALKRANITRIAGDLVVDASVFDEQYFHPSWPANQRDRWYQAEVAGLNFNDNCVDFRWAPGPAVGQPAIIMFTPNTTAIRVINQTRTIADPKKHVIAFIRQGVSNTFTARGSVQAAPSQAHSAPITNPPAFAAQVLIDVLAREGIAVAGKVRFERVRRGDGSLPANLNVIHRNVQALGPILWRCNTFSQNMMSECLFKALGAYDGKSPEPRATGSWASGRAAVLDFVRRHNLPAPAGLAVDDGSGLSKANRVPPALLGELLVRMAGHREKDAWFTSLANAGADGTLRARFGNLAEGQAVLAKTGTLSNAVSLSGYVLTRSRQFAFVILFDGISGGQWAARQAADRIVMTLLNDNVALQ